MKYAGINDVIAPEITRGDDCYVMLEKIARSGKLSSVLEIGSSSGSGSTEALVNGLRENTNRPQLYCMELSKPRFQRLAEQYKSDEHVHCYNVSSVPVDKFPTAEEVKEFYRGTKTLLNKFALDDVLGWLRRDITYIQDSGVIQNGIQWIKEHHGIETFDLVLIDGSEFTGRAELDEIYGAGFIVLDDINTFKNYDNYTRLLNDPNYKLFAQNPALRHGFAAFKKVHKQELPIHFFTIVLNGEPFIRYHVEMLRQLPFKWHWHIIEGVADLKHDTAWSVKQGGRITAELHNNGLSNDGTSEYLDSLGREFPNNITLYRKPQGQFWDGKLEMVNAPLVNIREDCLLWEVDSDELWTADQIVTGRRLFIDNPYRLAAYYSCEYFVGANMVTTGRTLLWLRTWLYEPGCRWHTHEPPRLICQTDKNTWTDVASFNPFMPAEMEAQGLVFQHFAYVTIEQLRFKEVYYGYKGAGERWQMLQQVEKFPVQVKDYLYWPVDGASVDTCASRNIQPLAIKGSDGGWTFSHKKLTGQTAEPAPGSVRVPSGTAGEGDTTIVIDGYFFQKHKGGIARVWHSLLQRWVQSGFAKNIVVLDRVGTVWKVDGIRYLFIPPCLSHLVAQDREGLQGICDQLGADLFVSTFYTTPLSTPTVLPIYDMIPEVMDWKLLDPMSRQKQFAIRHTAAYICISDNTARDLARLFPFVGQRPVATAHCGVDHKIFYPAPDAEIRIFRGKYGIHKPFFLLVGARGGYKNAMLFFRAFSELPNKGSFEIVCAGGEPDLGQDDMTYLQGTTVHKLRLSDNELRAAYSDAIALPYPSKYEGFGLPPLEAMACGCPVITCRNSSIPEVVGDAALFVGDEDVNGLVNALIEVQKQDVREDLARRGVEQAKGFSWEQMATTVARELVGTVESVRRARRTRTN